SAHHAAADWYRRPARLPAHALTSPGPGDLPTPAKQHAGSLIGSARTATSKGRAGDRVMDAVPVRPGAGRAHAGAPGTWWRTARRRATLPLLVSSTVRRGYAAPAADR